MRSISHTVHHAIAMHLDVSLAMIDDAQRLAEDLCLTPHLGSDEFPAEKLDDVDTVGELVSVFEDWASERDTYEEIDTTNLWEDRISFNP